MLRLFLLAPVCFFGLARTVTTDADALSNPAPVGSLRAAIDDINAAGEASNTITFDPGLTITLAGPLPPIYLANTDDALSITGNTTTIDGNSLYPGFFIDRGTVEISSLTLADVLAKGGDGQSKANLGTSGGGGGLGAGAAVFVGDAATVTVSGLSFSGSLEAAGGGGGSTTGTVSEGGGAGGGFHGSGGFAEFGGAAGGGGFNGSGGTCGRAGTGGGGAFGNGGSATPVRDGGTGGGGRFPGDTGGEGNTGTPNTGGVGGGTGGGAGGTSQGQSGGAGASGAGGGGGASSSVNGVPSGSGGLGGFGGGGGGAGTQTNGNTLIGSGGNGQRYGGGGGGGRRGGVGTGGGGNGGDGGDYGGGGGGSLGTSAITPGHGGDGGFGSGGGGGGGTSGGALANTTGFGGAGGFGGGGGGGGETSTTNAGGAGGIGGGAGGSGTSAGLGSGGGGAAAGGAFFVRSGGSLILDNDVPEATLTAGVSGTQTGSVTNRNGQTAGTSIFLNGTTNLTLNCTATRTVSGTIADDQSLTQGSGTRGNGSITKTGAGTLILSAANTYTGSTTINAGAVQISADNNLGAASATVLLNGGTLATTATFSTSRSISLGDSGGTFQTSGSTALTLGETILDAGTSGALTKTGAGTLVLSGANLYSGGTTVTAGTVSISANNNLGDAGGELVLDGGTLATSATFFLSHDISLGNGNGTFQTSGSTTLTLPEAMDDVVGESGALIKTGAGTLVLAGPNGYSGGTTVTGGTLSVSADNNLGDAAGDVAINGATFTASATFSTSRDFGLGESGATLEVAGGAVLTASGDFSDITTLGALTKTGAGTLLLSGTNTYSGDTAISAGTLQLGSGDALPSGTALTVAGTLDVNDQAAAIAQLLGSGAIELQTSGTLTLNAAETSSFSGEISGAAASEVANTAGSSLTLTGDNSAFLGSFSNAASSTLVGNSASLPADISNNGSLVFNQGVSGTYAKTLNQTASGNFQKSGAGTLNFTGNFVQETGTVAAGALLVNTSVFSVNTLTVEPGGSLGGGGIIQGSVINQGTLSPGNSIGTLSIVGDYTQASGSTFVVELNPAVSDRLIATGDITIASNTTLDIQPEVGTYLPNTSYLLLFSQGTLSGAFTTETTSLSALTFTTTYLSNALYLIVNITPFSELGLDSAALAVARCLDSASAPDGTDLRTVIDHIQFMSIPEMETTLHAMNPASLSDLDLAQEEIFVEIGDLLSFQMNQFCKNGGRKARLHSWAKYLGASQRQSSKGSIPGYSMQPESAIAGVDKTWQGDAFCGGALGYTHGPLYWKQNLGSSSLENGFAALYGGKVFPNKVYLQGALGAGLNFYRTKRNVPFQSDEFSPFVLTPAGSGSGFSTLAQIEVGGFLKKGAVVRPFGKVGYQTVYRGSYAENGGDGVDLEVLSHWADLLRTNLGIEASYCLRGAEGDITPIALFGGVFENRFFGKNQQARLKETGCLIEVPGMFPQRYFFMAEVGATASFIKRRLSFASNLHYEWWKDYRAFTWLIELGCKI